MKCTIPEISWHNKMPVLSIDVQPVANDSFYRLATSGTDFHVIIWYLKLLDTGVVNIEFASDLTKHQRSVNIVRWSPTGKYLASGDDDSNVILWYLKIDNIPLLEIEGDTGENKETWLVHKVLRGHKEDVSDISWSPCGLKLCSASVDNTVIMWNVSGRSEHILGDHKGYVQGVSWDPKGQFIASLSSDRIFRVFDVATKHVKSRSYKGCLPLSASHSLSNKEVKYFHDDTFKSFFRRLTFSPDGNLIITPSGCVETEDDKKALHATYIFTLDLCQEPTAILPSNKQITIAAKCCPILFNLRPNGPAPLILLPYRLIIAVAMDNDLVLYDTQQVEPFAHFKNIHYTRLTDLSWSSDGLLLTASSTDGFCTLVTFNPNELGTRYVLEESVEVASAEVVSAEVISVEVASVEVASVSKTKVEVSKSKKKETKTPEVKIKKPNILEKWAIKTPKRAKLDFTNEIENGASEKEETKQLINSEICVNNMEIEKIDEKKSGNDVIEIEDSPDKSTNRPLELKNITPRRITPFKVGSGSKIKLKEKEPENTVKTITPMKLSDSKNKITPQRKSRNDQSSSASMLKFLSVTPKSKGKVKAVRTLEIINISDDEEKARDAWHCEKESPNIADNVFEVDNDDDFKLQIEDSTLASQKSLMGTTSNLKSNLKNVSEEGNKVLKSTENTELVKPAKSEKVPRRVALITLSSPKNKKKS